MDFNLTEFEKLLFLVKTFGIPYTTTRLNDGHQIVVYYDAEMTDRMDDCIISRYSHGSEKGLLESYRANNCEGYETALGIFRAWATMYASRLLENEEF